MNLSFSFDGRLFSTEIKGKQVGVSTKPNIESALYSAIECGISGEPMESYHDYDGCVADLKSISLAFDSSHATRLSYSSSNWDYSSTGSPLKLHFIRCLLMETGNYRYRTFVTECSRGGQAEGYLKQNFYRVSDDLPLSTILRVGFGITNVFKTVKFEVNNGEVKFIREDSESSPSIELLRFLYELGILCVLDMENAGKIVVLPIDANNPFAEEIYKVIDFYASFKNIIHIIFTSPVDNNLSQSLGHRIIRL